MVKERCILSRLVFVSVFLTLSTLQAGDWPQILGSNRDGIAVNETLLKEWPAGGPQELWSAKVGQGFAGVAVRDDIVTLYHRLEAAEVVETRRADSGKKLWSVSFTSTYRSGMSSDSGPRCVPVVIKDRIITFGAEGHLRCLNRNDGSTVWERDTWKDFSAPEGYFGAGSSPLVIDDRVLVNVGGRDGAAIVCFALADGKTLWKCFDDTASYSSPIAARFGDRTLAVFITRLNTVAVDPASGAVAFQFPFGARGPTVNGANPIQLGQCLFVSSSYRVGSVLASVDQLRVTPRASGETLLATQYATPVKDNGLLYAVDGRQDVGSASIKCFDPVSGKTFWEESGFDYGTMIRVGADLLFLSCEGDFIRIAADKDGYRERHRSSVLAASPRGYRLPALSNGRLFIRDDNQLRCLHVGELSKPQTP